MRPLALALTFVSALACTATSPAEPVRLIFDTDMGNDVDDALALGVIHALQSRGACELLAVTVTKDHDLAAPFVDAINTFYGRGDIPIGVVRNGVTPRPGRFLPLVQRKDGDRPRYPHDLTSGRRAREAVSLLRETLAAQPDGSVVIVQVGFSTNLARLLTSRPDEHAQVDGRTLVDRKVRLLSIMAGAFRPLRGNPGFREFNVAKDIASAQVLARDWPTPVTFSGFEIGLAVRFPPDAVERDFGYVEHHPLADAYRAYEPDLRARPAWDLTSVLQAVFPGRGYFAVSRPGRVVVEDDGLTRFVAEDGGRHRYLKVTPEQVVRVTEALVQLASQPPG